MNEILNNLLSINNYTNKQIVSIITDNKGNIINNINTLPFFQLVLINLDILPNQKKLLLNTLDKNYTICKIPFEINACLYFQYIFEEWRMNNSLNTIYTVFNKNDKKLEYSSFHIFEQEVIYCLLNSYITDKEIETYLKKLTKNKIKGSIRHTVSMLHLRFNTNNRNDLIRLLKLYDFDQYVPKSLFPPGYYSYPII